MSRVVRVVRLTEEALKSANNAHLIDALIDIVLESFAPPDRETVVRGVLFRAPGSRFLLFYDAEDALLGFCAHVVQRVEVGGRPHGVLDVGSYLRAGARGLGLRMAWEVGLDLFRFMARHPRTPVCYLGAATNPAIYRLICRFNPQVFPNRRHAPPPEVTALVREAMPQKGYLVDEEDPWRAHIGVPVRLRDEERMRRFVERSTDPDVHFFVSRAPDYLEGRWLTVYGPLGPLILLRRMAALVKTLGRRKLSRR